MKVGIVGLGLIGGSLAKGYKRAGVEVFGLDKDILTQEYAQLAGAIDGSLDDETVKKCDLILIAITPRETVEWFKKKSDIISPETVVIDCCGTKRFVCRECAAIAEEKGIVYMGGHPMAGKEKGGFKSSSEDLFRNAPFILVPENTDDINLLMKIKGMIMLAGFGRVGVTTACEHDRVIAFTSQMPHILSNAFIKSKTALIDSQIIPRAVIRTLRVLRTLMRRCGRDCFWRTGIICWMNSEDLCANCRSMKKRWKTTTGKNWRNFWAKESGRKKKFWKNADRLR